MSIPTPRPTRVLVVDDEPKIRDLVRRYLQADGFEVSEAADGTTALTRFQDYRPDIIVLDVMMPVLNGLEVLRRIRSSSNVPVLLLTAREDEIDKVLGLTAGADDYVTKPFGGREVAARLHAILRRLDSPAPPPAPSTALANSPAGAILNFDNITIDIGRRQVTTRVGVPELTAMDFELLLTRASSEPTPTARRRLERRHPHRRTRRRRPHPHPAPRPGRRRHPPEHHRHRPQRRLPLPAPPQLIRK